MHMHMNLHNNIYKLLTYIFIYTHTHIHTRRHSFITSLCEAYVMEFYKSALSIELESFIIINDNMYKFFNKLMSSIYPLLLKKFNNDSNTGEDQLLLSQQRDTVESILCDYIIIESLRYYMSCKKHSTSENDSNKIFKYNFNNAVYLFNNCQKMDIKIKLAKRIIEMTDVY